MRQFSCDVVYVQMSSEKTPAAGQPPPEAGKPAVPQTTPLFRAMNFELFVKPVRSHSCCMFHL